MGCLFCDQTPESVDAREKLAEACAVANCASGDLVQVIGSMLSRLQNYDWRLAQSREENHRLQDEMEARCRRYAGLDRDASCLPDHYTRTRESSPFQSQAYWSAIYDEKGKKKL